MRGKLGLYVVLLALLSLFITLDSTAVYANPVDPCNGPQQPGSQTPLTNPKDTSYNNNAISGVQGRIILGDAISKMFPIAPALSACVTQLTNLLNSLSGITSPFDPLSGIIAAIVTSIITQVCTAALGEITSIQQDIKQFMTICLPLPNLSLNLPHLQLPPCLGMGVSGAQIPLIGPSPPQPLPTPPTPQSQYFKH
jgi:hypothetical protein